MISDRTGDTALYLDDDDMHDLTVVLDAADLLSEEQRKMGAIDFELDEAVENISTIAGIDMEEVREVRETEEGLR